MGTQAINRAYQRVKVLFLAVIILLPVQFYIVYSTDSLYPCLHLPGFGPVLDDTQALHYYDRNLVAIATEGDRYPVIYTELFHTLPEYYARHTFIDLFQDYNSPGFALLDQDTKRWIRERLVALTANPAITALEVETLVYRYPKLKPDEPELMTEKTVLVPLND